MQLGELQGRKQMLPFQSLHLTVYLEPNWIATLPVQEETVGLTNATAVRDMCGIMLQADAVLNNLHAICMVSFVPSYHL